MLKMVDVKKYDEELVRSLIDVINKTEVQCICIELDYSLLYSICTKIKNHIKDDLQTQNMISNYVSCFYLFL